MTCDFVNDAITLHQTALNSQGIYLFNDINYVIMIEVKVFLSGPEFEKRLFSIQFLDHNISHKNVFQLLKFGMSLDKEYIWREPCFRYLI